MAINKDSTQLRYISSKSIDKLMMYVNGLPYKIELKNLFFNSQEKKWYQTFTLSPEINKEMISGNLD